MQRQKPETELHHHKNKWTQQTKQQHHESSDKNPNKPRDQKPHKKLNTTTTYNGHTQPTRD
jgi:hypothetical protein